MTEKQQGLYVFKNGEWQEISSKEEAGDLPIATEEQLGAVKIGKGLDIDKSGILSTKTASKEAIESGVSDDEFITPKGLSESKEKIIKSVVDIEKYDKHLEKIASKDELGHFKVGRGLEIKEDGTLFIPENKTYIYGVEIDEENPDPFGAVTYIADSEGFEPLYTSDGNVEYGDWRNKFPINKVIVVLMKEGKVIEELDKNDYTKTIDGRTVDITSGVSGDVMVAIPLTYWKFERVGSKLRIYISNRQVNSGFKAYAHSRNGVVQDDYLYVGAFKGTVKDGKLRSLHDVMSTGSNTISKFREYAEANGEGYGQMNWATMTLMQIFTVLLTKSLDSQTTLGRGYVDDNDEYIKNGGTVDKGLFYGETTGKQHMKFLGIEDFWGNRYEWVDGLVRKDNKFWTNTNNRAYNDNAVGYVEAGVAPNFDDYFKTVTGTTESGFIPSERGGSSSTYYCDYYWYNSGHRVVAFGGDRSLGSGSGAFRLDAYGSPAYANARRGARCLYLKQK